MFFLPACQDIQVDLKNRRATLPGLGVVGCVPCWSSRREEREAPDADLVRAKLHLQDERWFLTLFYAEEAVPHSTPTKETAA